MNSRFSKLTYHVGVTYGEQAYWTVEYQAGDGATHYQVTKDLVLLGVVEAA